MTDKHTYAKSPMCNKNDMVNCWDCGRTMRQKNIVEHYSNEKKKNDPEHVGKWLIWILHAPMYLWGKDPHYYKKNQTTFSFNLAKSTEKTTLPVEMLEVKPDEESEMNPVEQSKEKVVEMSEEKPTGTPLWSNGR